jgi:hypothetical protein
MIEKEMEDLLALFPEDFFPNRRFVLEGRQKSFAEVGRFDLLFKDEHGWFILMELKAHTLKYEDASQVARYFDELHARGHENVIMSLIAPHIPTSIRHFLDDKGIQYHEIHVSDFKLVARKHGYTIASETEVQNEPTRALPADKPIKIAQKRPVRARVSPDALVAIGPEVTSPSPLRWRRAGSDLVLTNPESLDLSRFTSLVDEFEVRAGKKNASLIRELRQWAQSPGRNLLVQEAFRSLLRWTTTTGATYRSAVPSAEAVSGFLFGAPAPNWYWWDATEKQYKFDPEAWKVWFESLNHVPPHLEQKYREHNTDKPHAAPDMQCQCEDCKAYRSYQSGTARITA